MSRSKPVDLSLPFEAGELALLQVCCQGDTFSLLQYLEFGALPAPRCLDHRLLAHLEELLDWYPELDGSCLLSLGLIFAAAHHQFDLPVLLLQKAPEFGRSVDPSFCADQALLEALYCGNFPLVSFLIEELPRLGYPPVCLQAGCRRYLPVLAEQGNLILLRYLIEAAPLFGQQPLGSEQLDHQLLFSAISRGRQEVLAYLVEEMPFHNGLLLDLPDSLRGVAALFGPASRDCLIWYDAQAGRREQLQLLKNMGVQHQCWRELCEKPPEYRKI